MGRFELGLTCFAIALSIDERPKLSLVDYAQLTQRINVIRASGRRIRHYQPCCELSFKTISIRIAARFTMAAFSAIVSA